MSCERMDCDEFASFYDEYFGLVSRIALSILGDERESVSVADLTMWYAFSHPDKLRGMPTCAAEAYLIKVVRARSYDVLRHRARKQYTDISKIENSAYEVSDESVERTVELKDLCDSVKRCILSMPDIYRDVLTLRIADEMRISEIAATLDIPLDTAKSRCRRGMAILKRYMSARGYGDL